MKIFTGLNNIVLFPSLNIYMLSPCLSSVDMYLFKVNNGNTRTICEIGSKLTIKTTEQRHWRRSGVFIVDFEPVSHIVLVFPLLALTSKCQLCSNIVFFFYTYWRPQKTFRFSDVFRKNKNVTLGASRFGIAEIPVGEYCFHHKETVITIDLQFKSYEWFLCNGDNGL